MCRELPTAMVLGCVLQKCSRKEIPYGGLSNVGKALIKVGMLVNVSYPAVKKVAAVYPEITVVPNVNGFVVKKTSRKGVLFNPHHIRIAYGGGLDDGEFEKMEETVKNAVLS